MYIRLTETGMIGHWKTVHHSGVTYLVRFFRNSAKSIAHVFILNTVYLLRSNLEVNEIKCQYYDT